jgi:predicted ATPase
MIKNLEVKNFKSIKYLKLDCKKVNILIGKPNTGKSNILESIGIFSFPFFGRLGDFVRFENMINLFYDHDLGNKVEVTSGGETSLRVKEVRPPDFEFTAFNVYSEIKFENGKFIGRGGDKEEKVFSFQFDFNFNGLGTSGYSGISSFKFYRFALIDKFPRQEAFLLPPKGENLLQILLTNKALKKMVADIFSEFGLRIVLKPEEGKIEVQKEVEDVIISHPYSLASDTLQRIVFHLAAIESNKDSIIIFEEPEIHSFPFYTKFLAERISLDNTNQYFISTHNPYFLLSVLEKTAKNDIGIFIVYFKDYQTKARPILEEEMPEILDLDASIFFNLDEFLEKE